jgi:hypothetical protein
MKMTVVVVRPVIVSFDLTTLLFGSKHDNDAYVLLPHDVPKVLMAVSRCR